MSRYFWHKTPRSPISKIIAAITKDNERVAFLKLFLKSGLPKPMMPKGISLGMALFALPNMPVRTIQFSAGEVG